MIDWEKVAKAFSEMAQIIAEKVRQIWEAIESIEDWHFDYFKKKKQIENIRASWVVNHDTRKPSQVINNKPQYMVRKVIR